MVSLYYCIHLTCTSITYNIDINPKGLVPAVEFSNKAIYESLVILELLEDAYPSQKPSLLPSDPYERAFARIWIDYTSKSIIPATFRLIQAQEKDKQDSAREELVQAFKTFAEQIKGPYFLGTEFSLVDTAIAPWIIRDYIPREHRGFTRESVGSKWVEYTALIEKRDSVIRTTSASLFLATELLLLTWNIQDREHYAEIYGRYLRDEAQSEAAKATRAGRSFS